MIPISSARVISSIEAAGILGMPCYLILSGYAKPYFPTSNRSHPSRTVVVLPNGVGTAGVVPFGVVPFGVVPFGVVPFLVLPVVVDGEQWRRCVVPVMESDALSRENLATWSLPPSEVVTLIGRAIGVSFEAGGYGPYRVG